MTLLRRGDDVQEARSNYVINSLKAQGYVEQSEGDEPAPVQAPEEPTENQPEEVKPKRKRNKGQQTS